ncbi:MAG: hypothetical protein ACTHOP_10600 [Mesorhizobium sp.]|jgi:hypothetical protein
MIVSAISGMKRFIPAKRVDQPCTRPPRDPDARHQQAVAEGAGVCMLPERSVIVDGLALCPVDTLDLSRTVAFQSISGRERRRRCGNCAC